MTNKVKTFVVSYVHINAKGISLVRGKHSNIKPLLLNYYANY